MKIHAKIKSERGKEVEKSGNDYLIVAVNDKQRRKLVTIHITAARSHLDGEHYNVYVYNHQNVYLDTINGN